MNLFDFEDYRAFIQHQIQGNKGIRGYRSRLADAAGCRLSHLSQVLSGSVQLTPDQAAGLCVFWGFEPQRTDYFLALVHLARAGSPSLKAVLQRQIREAQERHREAIGRVAGAVALPIEQAALYHSTWHRSAVHALVSLESCRTASALAKRLRLSVDETLIFLTDLERMGLVGRKGELWHSTGVNTIIPAASPISNNKHSNWRLVAIERLSRRAPQDLHYTGVITLSKQDLAKVRRMSVEFLNQVIQTVETSVDEECVCLTLDLLMV